jgi:hypothetical protein
MSYNSAFLSGDRINTATEWTKHLIDKNDLKFDAIAVRGISGMIIGAPLAANLGKPLIVVRKPSEKSHGEPVEVPTLLPGKFRYIIIDDMIASGETVRSIVVSIKLFFLQMVHTNCTDHYYSGTCVAIILYNDGICHNSYSLSNNLVDLTSIPIINFMA